MDAHLMLIEAQMHLECMNEVFLEMEGGMLGEERQHTAYHDLLSRLWPTARRTGLPREAGPGSHVHQGRAPRAGARRRIRAMGLWPKGLPVPDD